MTSTWRDMPEMKKENKWDLVGVKKLTFAYFFKLEKKLPS